MPDLPSHPDDDGAAVGSGTGPVNTGMSRGRKAALIAIVLLLVALVVVLHVAGVVGKGTN
jgi:hypothetical protein